MQSCLALMENNGEVIIKTMQRSSIFLVVLAVVITIFLIFVFVQGCSSFTDTHVQVPDLTNYSLNTAESLAKKRGLTIVVDGTPETSEFVPEGNIISQNPIAGEIIKSARQIYVVISKGKKGVVVPNVVGKSFGDAQGVLLALGLKIGEITDLPSNSSDVGIVSEQFPAPDTTVDKNTPVSLSVSIGSLSTVPNIIGMDKEEAAKVLIESGFENINFIADKAPFAQAGIVLRQDPEPGLHCDTQNRVDLHFNQP
jgi:serine/threonine-protein kinase